VNSLLNLCLPGHQGLATRLEDVSVRGNARGEEYCTLLVAEPNFSGDFEPPQRALPVLVRWTGESGLFEARTKFLNRELLTSSLHGWRLQLDDVDRLQRRNYVRVPWRGEARLTWLEPVAIDPVSPRRATGCRAGILNLSEGGLGCAIPPGPRPEPGTRLLVGLELDGAPLELRARLVWVRPPTEVGPDRTPRWQAGLEFGAPNPAADRLRAAVFNEQLRARRVGLA
jgi:hypothetical protein